MAIWMTTLVLIVVLGAIVRAELRSGRRTKVTLKETNAQIDDLAQETFARHREMFGRDATGAFPIRGTADAVKK